MEETIPIIDVSLSFLSLNIHKGHNFSFTFVEPVNEMPATFGDSQSTFPTSAVCCLLLVITLTTPTQDYMDQG